MTFPGWNTLTGPSRTVGHSNQTISDFCIKTIKHPLALNKRKKKETFNKKIYYANLRVKICFTINFTIHCHDYTRNKHMIFTKFCGENGYFFL